MYLNNPNPVFCCLCPWIWNAETEIRSLRY